MATEKNPSIYYDRGTIGSSDELDEYGVWVKSEPQDLSTVGKESSDLQDPFIMDLDENLDDMLGDLPDFEDSLPSDDAASVEGLSSEDLSSDISQDEISSDLNFNADTDDFSLDLNLNDDIHEEQNLDLDIPEMEDIDLLAENTDSLDETHFAEHAKSLEDTDFDLSIPDIDDEVIPLDDDFDLDIDFDDTNSASADELESGDDNGFSEISMDDFLSDSPQDDAASADKSFTIESIEDIALDDLDETNIAAINLDTDDENLSEDETLSIDDLDETNIAAINLDTDDENLSEDETLSIDDLDETNIAAIDFDDVAALSDDLQSKNASDDSENETITIDDIDEANRSSINGDKKSYDDSREAQTSREMVSAELLQKIAGELSSIRQELSSLKAELSSVKTETSKNVSENVPGTVHETEEEAGFFDAEDDDKISLTGDELDNILHSADFTEETGKDASPVIEDDDIPDEITFDEEIAEAPAEAPIEFLDETSFAIDQEDALTGDELDNIVSSADFTEELGEDVSPIIEDDDIPDEILFDNEIIEAPEEIAAEETISIDDAEEIADIPAEEVPLELDTAETAVLSEEDLPIEEIEPEEFSNIDISFEDEGLNINLDETEVSDMEMPEIDMENFSYDDGVINADLSFDSSDTVSEIETSENEISFDNIQIFEPSISISESLELEPDISIEETPDAVSEISLDDSVVIDEPAVFEIEDEEISFDDHAEKDTKELKQLREEGAKPLTQVTDDVSYLQDENVDAIDLSDINIEEAEASDTDDTPTANPAEESSLEDLSIDLDVLEEAPPADDLNIEFEDLEEVPLAEDSAVELNAEEPSLTEDLGIELDLEESPVLEDFELPEIDAEPEEELELSVTEKLDTADDIHFSDTFEEDVPQDENLEQLVPEGFFVESDDSDLSLNDSENDFEETETIHLALDDDSSLEPMEEILPIVRSDDFETVDLEAVQPAKPHESDFTEAEKADTNNIAIPQNLKTELRTVLSYMDKLLESLPEDKIEEFAKSEYFDTYKKLFEELGLV